MARRGRVVAGATVCRLSSNIEHRAANSADRNEGELNLNEQPSGSLAGESTLPFNLVCTVIAEFLR